MRRDPKAIHSPCTMIPSERTVSSVDTDASSLPSVAEKATELIEEEWPSKVCRTAPVCMSQSRIDLSPDPEMIQSPSGEKAPEMIACLVESIQSGRLRHETFVSMSFVSRTIELVDIRRIGKSRQAGKTSR